VYNPLNMSTTNPFPSHLSLTDFGYDLPEERIARYPLAERDQSKLLVWKAGALSESSYAAIADFIPDPSMLVFNNSRVMEARILFQKPAGGQIEVFCLEPHQAKLHFSEAMAATGKIQWACLIGGASKWKRGQMLEKKFGEILLQARFVEKRTDDFIVEFSWTPPDLPFSAVLQQTGTIPLPPYLKRSAEISDSERYQTVYAHESGSVAAPTAGLHFSENLLQRISARGIDCIYLTLHVGAGTFMPVKTPQISEHHMHEEYIEVSAASVQSLIDGLGKTIIAVGTTSLRTLETLYWLGVHVSRDKNIPSSQLYLDQWYPYNHYSDMGTREALQFLLEWIRRTPMQKLITKTQLFIVPGYKFKMVRGLVTNFHQPHSTLLMLVAALIGPEWKNVYAYALENGYRFLSYGDGCLFLPPKN
jgi:S-adenosylmethionine:tRNA ribosyltransferase-isomerase